MEPSATSEGPWATPQPLIVSRPGGWDLALGNWYVIGVRQGFAASIELSPGRDGPIAVLQVEGTLEVHRPHFPPQRVAPIEAEQLLGSLVGTTVTTAKAEATGDFLLTINDGTTIAIAHDEEYEPWSFVGVRGERLVSTPGSAVTVWSAT